MDREQTSSAFKDNQAAGMRRYLRWFFHLLTVVSFAALLFAIYKDASYQNHLASRPETAQSDLGRTIPHHARHHMVYISPEEARRVDELESYRRWSAVALVVFGLIGAGLDRSRPKTSDGKS